MTATKVCERCGAVHDGTEATSSYGRCGTCNGRLIERAADTAGDTCSGERAGAVPMPPAQIDSYLAAGAIGPAQAERLRKRWDREAQA